MPNYAFIDMERTKKITIDRSVILDKNKEYFCPNEECNSRLKVCSHDGIRKPYFRAVSVSHNENCPYYHNNNFDSHKFEIKNFSFDDVMNNIIYVQKTTNPNRQNKNQKK